MLSKGSGALLSLEVSWSWEDVWPCWGVSQDLDVELQLGIGVQVTFPGLDVGGFCGWHL